MGTGQLLSVRVWADLIKQLSLDNVSQFTAVAVSIRFLTCIEAVLECHECMCQTSSLGNGFVYLKPK